MGWVSVWGLVTTSSEKLQEQLGPYTHGGGASAIWQLRDLQKLSWQFSANWPMDMKHGHILVYYECSSHYTPKSNITAENRPYLPKVWVGIGGNSPIVRSTYCWGFSGNIGKIETSDIPKFPIELNFSGNIGNIEISDFPIFPLELGFSGNIGKIEII